MKFKNSYILLITIAIFLLISIGSVCANDNIEANNSSLAIADGNDVINDDNTHEGITKSAINTTIDADDTKEFKNNEDKIITVTVKDNESNIIPVEKNNLTLFEGSTEIGFTYNNTQLKITDSLSIGDHNLIIKYLGNANYTNSTKTIQVKILGSETGNIIHCDDVIVKTDSEAISFIVNVTTNNGTPIAVTNDNFKVYNGTSLLDTTYDGTKMTINKKLKNGVYILSLKFLGDATYNATSKNITLKIYTIKINGTVKVNSTKKGEAKLNITDGKDSISFTKDEIDISLSYVKDNKTVIIPIKTWDVVNNVIVFEVENDNFTSATLNVTYKNTCKTNATVNRVYNIKVTPITTTQDYQEGNFTFQLTDMDTNELLRNKTVTISLTKNGTNVYFITKNDQGYSLGTTLTVTSDANGIITLKNENFYPGLVFSDKIFPPIGEYQVKIGGTGIEDKSGNNTKIKINPIDVNIVLENYNEYYGSDKKVKIIVTNAKTGAPVPSVYILLNVSGANLTNPNQMTDANGTIQLGVSGLYPNTFNITYQENDTNINSGNGSGSFTIKQVPVVIKGDNVKIYYNTGSTYTIKVTRNGKAVSGMYILVRLYSTSSKYNDYLFMTNNKGQVSFSASLAVGKHKIIVSSADTRYNASKITKTITVKKASGKFKANKVNTYYKSGKALTIKLTNTKNKKPIYAAKVNVKVFVTKTKYYNYNGNTAMNGKLKLSVDTLKPGSYKIVISDADKKDYSAKSITTKAVIKKAKTKLSAKKITANKGENKYMKITTSKKMVGATLKVKVYTGKSAKTYKIKTDSKGAAKLSTKSLSAGKHKVVASISEKYTKGKKAKSTITIK